MAGDVEKLKRAHENPFAKLSQKLGFAPGWTVMSFFDRWFGDRGQQEGAARQPSVAETLDPVVITDEDKKKIEDARRRASRLSPKAKLGIAGAAGSFMLACAFAAVATQTPGETTATPESSPTPTATAEIPDDQFQIIIASPDRWAEIFGEELAAKLRAFLAEFATVKNPNAVVILKDDIKAGYGIGEGQDGIPVGFTRVADGEALEPCGTIFLETNPERPGWERLYCEASDSPLFIAEVENGVWTVFLPASVENPNFSSVQLKPGEHDPAIAYFGRLRDILKNPRSVETPDSASLIYDPEVMYLERGQTQCEVGAETIDKIAGSPDQVSVSCGPFHDPTGVGYDLIISQEDGKQFKTELDDVALKTGASRENITLHTNGQNADEARHTFIIEKDGKLMWLFAKTTDGREIASGDPYNWWSVAPGEVESYMYKPVDLPTMQAGERLTVRWGNDNDERYVVIENALGQVHWLFIVNPDGTIKTVLNPFYLELSLLPAGLDTSTLGFKDDVSQLILFAYAENAEPDAVAVRAKGVDSSGNPQPLQDWVIGEVGTETPTAEATPQVTATPEASGTPDTSNMSYEEQILASPDRFVCLPEHCLNGEGKIDQEKAQEFNVKLLWSYIPLGENKTVFEQAGYDISTLDSFTQSLLAKNYQIPAGLVYIVPDTSRQGWYTTSKDTWPAFSASEGIFEVLNSAVLVKEREAGRIKNAAIIDSFPGLPGLAYWSAGVRDINGQPRMTIIVASGQENDAFISGNENSHDNFPTASKAVNAMFNFMLTLAPHLIETQEQNGNTHSVPVLAYEDYPLSYTGPLPDYLIDAVLGSRFQRLNSIDAAQILVSSAQP